MNKRELQEKRKIRVRAKFKGMATCPRLSVFRSSRFISAQLIDDEARKTLVAVSEKELNLRGEKGTKVQRAALVGEMLAKKASKMKIKKVVFDRGPYRYHGRVASLAQAARKGGLKF